MEDPISGEDYEPTPDGLKQWAHNEWRHGVPGLFAVIGFVAMGGVWSIGITLWSLVQGTPPAWVWIVAGFFALLCGFGGWETGYQQYRTESNSIPEVE
jgi:hypothetical protein